MTAIIVKLDVSKFVAWAKGLSDYKLRLATKAAINKAARAARTSAIEVIALDEGVPQARAKKSISKLNTASPSNLKATWTAGAQRIGILSTAGAKFSKGSGLTARTHVLTGGGSSRLSIAKAFVIQANGGRVLMIRKARGRGKQAIKAVYAETPSTGLGQADAAGRKVWQRTAETRLNNELNSALSAVFAGGSAPNDGGSND